jgi:cytochrome c556
MRPLALLTLLALGAAGGALAAAVDPRELVVLPEMMRQHMLANMRDHLRAMAEIQDALADGRFDVATNIAEQRLGMSSLAAHGASHMAAYLPEPMRTIGSRMHGAASRFALVAEEASVDRDLSSALKALAAVTAQCNSCHAAYRVY